MKKNTPSERLINGIIKENPTFVLMLGMCPTLAITTSAINGIGMGLTTTVILAASNLMISLLRNFIPDSVRMPAYIVVVASFVTIVQMLLQGFIPFLYSSLGIYIPLIVVNCIIPVSYTHLDVYKRQVLNILNILNTICNATEERQREAKSIAGEVDTMSASYD